MKSPEQIKERIAEYQKKIVINDERLLKYLNDNDMDLVTAIVPQNARFHAMIELLEWVLKD